MNRDTERWREDLKKRSKAFHNSCMTLKVYMAMTLSFLKSRRLLKHLHIQ
ncbi:MAG: hypothetical protein ACR2QW_17155 [bacterium]